MDARTISGTGHHYLADVLQSMCKTASVPCPKVCGLAHALYPGVSIPKSAVDYERARRELRQELVSLYFCLLCVCHPLRPQCLRIPGQKQQWLLPGPGG